MMNDVLARNLLAMLQHDPYVYRTFGWYWWYIKSELKRYGFGQEQFHGLGELTDPECEAWYKRQPHKELLTDALLHHRRVSFADYGRDTHVAPMSAGGALYVLYDSDVE